MPDRVLGAAQKRFGHGGGPPVPGAVGRPESVRIERRPGAVVVVGGPVPPGADAITIGSVISVRAGREDSPYLMRHEAVHVRQWHRFGLVGFASRYLGAYAKWRVLRKGHAGAYRRIPFEIEADWVARRSG